MATVALGAKAVLDRRTGIHQRCVMWAESTVAGEEGQLPFIFDTALAWLT